MHYINYTIMAIHHMIQIDKILNMKIYKILNIKMYIRKSTTKSNKGGDDKHNPDSFLKNMKEHEIDYPSINTESQEILNKLRELPNIDQLNEVIWRELQEQLNQTLQSNKDLVMRDNIDNALSQHEIYDQLGTKMELINQNMLEKLELEQIIADPNKKNFTVQEKNIKIIFEFNYDKRKKIYKKGLLEYINRKINEILKKYK